MGRSQLNMCLSGYENDCPEARTYSAQYYDVQGSVCSYALRKEQRLFKIPENLSSDHAVPLMCISQLFFLYRHELTMIFQAAEERSRSL